MNDTNKNSLSKFQNNLITSLREKTENQNLFVAINLDGDKWLINLSSIKEASVPPNLSTSEHAPDWVIGIGNFKGKVWTVLDMRILLHNSKSYNPKAGWVTLLHPQCNHEVALLWSEIDRIAPMENFVLSNEETDIHPWSNGVWIDKNGNKWNEFNIDKLIGENGLISQWVNGNVNSDEFFVPEKFYKNFKMEHILDNLNNNV